MVIAVDDRDIDVGAAQVLGRIQPRKTRAQDDDLRARFGTLGVSHWVGLGIDSSKWIMRQDQLPLYGEQLPVRPLRSTVVHLWISLVSATDRNVSYRK